MKIFKSRYSITEMLQSSDKTTNKRRLKQSKMQTRINKKPHKASVLSWENKRTLRSVWEKHIFTVIGEIIQDLLLKLDKFILPNIIKHRFYSLLLKAKLFFIKAHLCSVLLVPLKSNSCDYSVIGQVDFCSGEVTILCIDASSHTENPITSVRQGLILVKCEKCFC